MGFCKKEKKKRAPLKPRQGPYIKTNAYTTQLCREQILTLVCAWTLVILHSVFVVKPVIKIDHPILYVLLSVNYVLVVGLILTYVQVTRFDPVDSFILEPGLAELKTNLPTRSYCHLCKSFIHQKSYHCKRCGRCTEDFDHHCVYLNSCIGSKNYELFFRILLFYILFLLNNIGQAVWVFVAALSNEEVRAATITQWMEVVIMGLCTVQLIATLLLLWFHCYISCCLDVTTLMFIESEQKSHEKERVQTEEKVDPSNPDEPSPSNLIFMKGQSNNNSKEPFQNSALNFV